MFSTLLCPARNPSRPCYSQQINNVDEVAYRLKSIGKFFFDDSLANLRKLKTLKFVKYEVQFYSGKKPEMGLKKTVYEKIERYF